MSAIVWQDPPNDRRTNGGKYVEFVAALRQHAGRWALFSDNAARSVASDIRQGSYAAFRPPAEFETRTVTKPGTSRVQIYVRHIGGAQ